MNLQAQVVWQIGPLAISDTVITTWGLMAVLAGLCWLLTRRLKRQPSTLQAMTEALVGAIEEAVGQVIPDHVQRVLPLIGTLWIFLVCANLLGLIPGLHSPTRDLSTTTALAILVFFSVHWFGIRHLGVKRYLRHYLSPSPILLPFHVIGEITRTLALAVRLFGNMMSLEMAAMLVLLVAGFLAPIPLLMLHIIEALVQAYIFGMLALMYVAGSMQSQSESQRQSKENRDE
ncbi:F0F1 ATP synthase subunit A [Aestuariirhabdus litorea]|uniref:ATP synthase subunit a n=1 Tax=Aestuariirhabdus litorea TaxID=2528527 RepID=A0A3P3VMZ3_9GAMM|nr:F0F1 ATP synthase subunit A [Aestuariirhabdus litorea]RRJ84131.1 F0F1 ATP synthase subunit A [Aestuariirhabdus litorea]RWW97351.1 F0F1 ATP synthase subunit A [Endozoicomonadaceae bacterium GTF-13]